VSEDGIGPRSTAGELREAEPSVEFGQWDIDAYVAEAFHSPSGLGGRVDWDPIADLRRALNDRGADLVVDGTFGPRTSDALSEFQSTHGIDESEVGPMTLEALGVDVRRTGRVPPSRSMGLRLLTLWPLHRVSAFARAAAHSTLGQVSSPQHS
jgi:hypothetical protein